MGHSGQLLRILIAPQPIRRLRMFRRRLPFALMQTAPRYRQLPLSLFLQREQQRQISFAATALRALRIVGLAHRAAHDNQISCRLSRVSINQETP
jgi:hypothetical protein